MQITERIVDHDFNNTHQRNAILNVYNQRVIDAYNSMLKELIELFWKKTIKDDQDELANATICINKRTTGITLTGIPTKVKGSDNKVINTPLYNKFLEITGRCGGRCSAAKKAAQADFIVHAFQVAQATYDLDLTTTVVRHAAKKILGTRSISKEKAAIFATAGRKATHISPLINNPTPLDAHIDAIKDEIKQFDDYCFNARQFYTQQWHKVWKEQAQKHKSTL